MTENEIESILNLGKTSAAMLREAGITTVAQVRQLGPVKTFLAVKRTGVKPSKNLYGQSLPVSMAGTGRN